MVGILFGDQRKKDEKQGASRQSGGILFQEKRRAEKLVKSSGFRMDKVDEMRNTMQQLASQAEEHQAAQRAQREADLAKKKEQMYKVPIAGPIIRGIDKLTDATKPLGQGAASVMGVPMENKVPINSTLDKIMYGAGAIAGGFVNPAALEQSLVTAPYKAAQGIVSRTLPKAGNITQRAATGALSGAATGAMFPLLNTKGDLKDIAEGAAIGGALGGAGDAAFGAIGSAISRRLKRNGVSDDEVQSILALPMGREDAARMRRSAVETPDVITPDAPQLALPSPTLNAPTTARIAQRANPYREQFEQLIKVAQERQAAGGMTPGREDYELEQMWAAMAGREAPNLDELINLAYPKQRKLSNDTVIRARENQIIRNFDGNPLPVKTLAERYPQGGVKGLAAAPQTVPARAQLATAEVTTPRVASASRERIGTPLINRDEAEVEQIIQRVKEPRLRDKVYNYLDEAETAARKRMAARRGQLNSNPLPEWGDMSIIMASKMGKGTIKLADFTEEAVKEFGENVRTRAPQLFRSAKEELQNQARKATKAGQDADEFNNSGIGNAETFAKKVNYTPNKKNTPWAEKLFQMRKAFVDDLAGAERAEIRVYGHVNSAEKSIYKTSRLTKGIPEKANLIVQERLNPIIDSVEKAGYTPEQLGNYALAKHAQDVNNAGYKSGFTNAEIKDILSRYENVPELEAARKGLVNISREMSADLVDSGVRSQELQDVLFERWPNYIPLFRALEDESVGTGISAADKLANIADPLKVLKGSEKDVIDPLENLVRNIFQSTNSAERNRVGQQLAQLAKDDVEGTVARKLEDTHYLNYKVGERKLNVKITAEEYEQLGNMTKEERALFTQEKTNNLEAKFTSKSKHEESVGRKNVVNVKENGENVKYEVEPELYKALMSLDKESSNLIVNILSKPASMLRSGATLTPEFSLRNPMRDVLQAFVTSKSGFNPITDFGAGLISTIAKNGKKGQLYRDWVNNLGAYGNVMSMDRNVHREALTKVLGESAGKKFVNIVTGKSLLHMLRYITDTTESATKVGEYRAAIRQGQTPQEAAYRARDLMDFARAGSGIRQANKMIAFLNANIQGKSKLIRAIKENPTSTLARAFTAVTVPTIGIYVWNHSLSSDKQKSTIEESPDWLKDSFWLIAIPGTDMVGRIPKPFDLAPIFANLPERVLKFTQENDTKAFDGYVRSLVSSGAVPTQISGLVPLLEGMANYSFFRDGSIIPKREEGLAYKDQYDPIRTTETAKLLSGIVGAVTNGKGPFKNFASPRVMDNTIQGLTAGLGTYATSAVDSLLQGKIFDWHAFSPMIDRPDTPQKRLEQRPLIKSFLVDPLTNSRSLDKLYDERDKLTRESGSAKLNEEKFADSRRLKSLNSAATRISKIGKEIREIEASEKFTPSQKRRMIEPLLQERNSLAKKQISQGR